MVMATCLEFFKGGFDNSLKMTYQLITIGHYTLMELPCLAAVCHGISVAGDEQWGMPVCCLYAQKHLTDYSWKVRVAGLFKSAQETSSHIVPI